MHAEQRSRQLISVVIPVWNEEEGVPQLVESLDRVRSLLRERGGLQLVFVDDGSSDETPAALGRAFGNGAYCRIITHETNRGIGAAFRTGFAAAEGDLVCTIDADCTYRPEGLKALIAELDRTGADIAVASPYHPDGQVEGVARWRLLLSKSCSALYRLFAPVKLYTYTSVFRAYRSEVIKTVEWAADGFVSAPEILVRAAEHGYRIVEVPMTLHARRVGQSKMKILRTIRGHLALLRTTLAGKIGLRRSEMTIPGESPLRPPEIL